MHVPGEEPVIVEQEEVLWKMPISMKSRKNGGDGGTAFLGSGVAGPSVKPAGYAAWRRPGPGEPRISTEYRASLDQQKSTR